MKENLIHACSGSLSSRRVVRLKFVARLNYGDSLESSARDDEGNVRVFGSNGPVGRHSAANTSAPVIIVGRKGSFGSIQFSAEPVFAIDTTYFIDPTSTKANLRWLFYALQTLGLDAVSQDTGVPGLSRNSAYEALVPLPTLEEQRIIADFLDRETANADALVAKYGRLIELLEEKRAALITRAVTKGLDPHVPMKETGVPRIGEIPQNWEMHRLRRLGNFISGGTPSDDALAVGGDVPFYRVADIRKASPDGFLASTDCSISRRAAAAASIKVFARDSVVFAKRGAALLQGRYRVLPADACIDTNMMGCVPDQSRVLPRYLMLAMRLVSMKRIVNPGAIPSVDARQLDPELVPVAPLVEQLRILDHLDACSADLAAIQARLSHAVALVREHRSALITAAVTGQIDVRTYKAKDLEEVVA